jgi:hypothetical protein
MTDGYKAGSIVKDGGADAGSVLASDADRDAVAGRLSSALAEGRLTTSEHAERVEAAYATRTAGALSALTADLPAPARDAGGRDQGVTASDAAGGTQAVADSGTDRCLICALLILCPPAGIAWLLMDRKRARTPVARQEN